MSAQLNTYGNCDSEGKGSGRIGCDKSNWGDLKGFVLARKNTFWAVTDLVAAITKQLWLDGIDGLKLFPYTGAHDYESTPGANEYNTSTTQVKVLIRNGLPEISFMYADGNCRHASLWDKQGNKKWDVILLYANGMRMAHNFDLSKVMGFNAGHFSVDTETIQKATDLQISKCTFQLLDADQFAVQNAFFTWAELGFDAREFSGFNDIYVKVDAVVPGTELSFSAVAECNKSVNISTIDDKENWKITGVQATPTDIDTIIWNPDTNKFDVTLTEAVEVGDTIGFSTKRAAFAVAADIADERYKGSSALVTVAANVNAPVITSSASAAVVVGTPFTYNTTATNTPTSYAVVDALPTGLILNTSTGVISGTPSGSAGTRIVRLEATNGAGTGTKIVTFNITT